jgi:glycosyltransferase involved in cell wall biosynthesis
MNEGIINYLGETRDVRPYLADCNIFVLPSYYREGIPRSIHEALATGRAVITTDLPGCSDTVEEGVNGYLVAPQNPADLAKAMFQFAQDPSLARAMGLQSRRIAENKFDVHRVNRQLLTRMGLI